MKHQEPVRVGVVAALTLALLLSSCSPPEEEPAIETLPAEVSSSTTPTTSPTTTTTETLVTTTSPEQSVLEVHTRFMTEFFARDESATSPLDRIPMAEELTVDPQLARSTESIERAEQALDREYVISPGYDSNVLEVEIDAASAVVTDCSLDRGVLYSSDGEVLIDVDEDDYRVRRTNLVLIDDEWFVSEFFTGGGERCEPEA